MYRRYYSVSACLRAMLIVLIGILLTAISCISLLAGTRPVEAQIQSPALSPLVNGCWTPFTSLSAGVASTNISQLAVASPTDIWAVGDSISASGQPQALALQWDGQQWAAGRIQNEGYTSNTLSSIAAVSTKDVWAIGSYVRGVETGTYVVHWDGAKWKQVAAPRLAAVKARFFSMAAVSSTDIWAVGADYSTLNNSGGEKALIAHWDGDQWSLVPIPEVSGGLSVLRGVAVVSSADIWAVGVRTGTGARANTFQPLILHWNGREWSSASTPELTEGGQLYGVAALNANNVWAVGNKGGGLNTKPETLAMHWDGSRWATIPSPSPRGANNVNTLFAVSPVAADNVWAVGEAFAEQPLVLHWDGKQWIEVDLPAPTAVRVLRLRSVAASSSGDVWLVGQAVVISPGNGSNNTVGLLLRHSTKQCPDGTSTVESARLSVPGSGSQFFGETGKSVTGIFLDYWTRNGGLPQYGLPISNLLREVNELNGKAYTVQYFERAVFEYHPENKPPYDVLLSQLGTFRYKEKYPSGASGQQPQEGGVYFPETGKRLAGLFLEYWRRNGGLPQYGYPISDPFMEKSDLNGQTYTVQYFERAVFEYHPENKPPYDVLLSQLGTFRHR